MANNSSGVVRNTGIGFPGLLTILFVGLKLTGYIDWSWWWVVSPLWIPLVVVFLVFLILVIAVLVKKGE